MVQKLNETSTAITSLAKAAYCLLAEVLEWRQAVKGQHLTKHIDEIAAHAAESQIYAELKSASLAVCQVDLSRVSVKCEAAVAPPDLDRLLCGDVYLKEHTPHIAKRYAAYHLYLSKINKTEGGLDKFTKGYETRGFFEVPGAVNFKEWCPGVASVAIVGEFNEWDATACKCVGDEYGSWSASIPNTEAGAPGITPGSRVALHITTHSGEAFRRIPAWITRAIQRKDQVQYLYPAFPVFGGLTCTPHRGMEWGVDLLMLPPDGLTRAGTSYHTYALRSLPFEEEGSRIIYRGIRCLCLIQLPPVRVTRAGTRWTTMASTSPSHPTPSRTHGPSDSPRCASTKHTWGSQVW